MPKIVDVEAMQDRILSAAFSCFATRGYHAARMSDVAQAAGLAKGTLYLYFSSKAALTQALIAREFAMIEAISKQGPPADLASLMEQLRDTLLRGGENRQAIRMFFEVMGPGLEDGGLRQLIAGYFQRLGQSYGAALTDLQAQGAIRRDVEPEAAGRALAAMLDGMITHAALFDIPEVAFAGQVEASLQVIEAGLMLRA